MASPPGTPLHSSARMLDGSASFRDAPMSSPELSQMMNRMSLCETKVAGAEYFFLPRPDKAYLSTHRIQEWTKLFEQQIKESTAAGIKLTETQLKRIFSTP